MTTGTEPGTTPGKSPAEGAATGAGAGGKSLANLIVPFVPIVLALAAAMIARHYQKSDSMRMGAGDAGATGMANPHGLKVDSLAPDFSLPDAHAADGDEPVTLSILTERSPVLIVFYLSYSCPRCVGNLAEIDARLAEFKKAGVQVIAISPDTPAETRDSIQAYNTDFHFPLLSDRDLKTFRVYGLLGDDGHPMHGAFIVDKNRHIRFTSGASDHPFDDIDRLLEAGAAAK